MSKHTPGPWFVEDNDRAISSNAATDIALVNMANIRYGWDGPDFVTASHRAANARLIAAAPLMYSLLSMRAAEGDNEAINLIRSIDNEGMR